MGIDYYGSFRCKVREKISDAELLRMEKARARAETVLDIMRRNPGVNKDKPESEWTFKAVIAGPNGPQETELKIGDMLREAAPLEPLAVNCPQCPFNVRSDNFGCGGVVHYPISARGRELVTGQASGGSELPSRESPHTGPCGFRLRRQTD